MFKKFLNVLQGGFIAKKGENPPKNAIVNKMKQLQMKNYK